MSSTNKLPQKESGLFKKIVRCYEYKQYKNGLKFAKQILSNPKFSEHGETLSMKGLILNCVGRKEEAFEHVRRGLRNDITSHVCWHVYGLLQRADKKYDEAIKCYRNALKWDKENIQILRDLSLLQIQMRDLEGFRDTRYQLLKARPAQRGSWIGYALSYHLLKDYPMALKVMAEYRKTQIVSQTKPDYEFNEMILYEARLMSESGHFGAALAHLEERDRDICDRLALTEAKAEIYLEKNQHTSAELIYRDLIDRNPDNSAYYEQLEKCLKITSAEDRLAFYEKMLEQYPRSHLVKRKMMICASGSKFEELVDKYLKDALRKVVPSIFISIKVLYSDPEKVKCIGKLCEGYLQSLESCQRLSLTDPDPAPPTTFLWTLYLLAQHLDKTGDQVRALELINRAIQHTPTEVHLYMTKARICKHAGNHSEASRWMEEARTFDTADRFVNCKSVKYMLRTNQVERAIETAGLFTREGLPPLQTMDEMQCMWFQQGLGAAYERLGMFGDALQKFHEIDRHFVDIIEDQFDFHTYCMRKMTLRAYVDVLTLEDTVRQHPFYFKAAVRAIKVYIHLHDNPSAKTAKSNGPTKDDGDLSAAELKKQQRKQKKAQHKAAAQVAGEEKKENKPLVKSDEEKKPEEQKQPKFDPQQLLMVEHPLQEAVKFLIPLQQLSKNYMETHLLAYEVHSRRKKFLLMLQALKRSHSISPDHPQFHVQLVDFMASFVQQDLAGPVGQVIKETLPQLTGSLDSKELNETFLEKHSDSLPHLIAGAQVMYRLSPELKDKAVAIATNLSDGLKGRTLKSCIEVQELLRSGFLGDCSSVIEDYQHKCQKLYPMATAFRSVQDQQLTHSTEHLPGSAECQEVCQEEHQGDIF
eukprot:Em0022g551a